MIKRISYLSQTKTRDLPLLIIAGVLVGFGLLILFDASTLKGIKDFNDSYYYIRQQLIWACIGIASLLFFSHFNYRKFKIFAFPLMILSFLMLVGVLIPGLGVSGGGAHRWLKLGPIPFQPAEIIKLTAILFLSTLFEKKTRLFPLVILIVAVTFVTAILQKDLGSTIVFVAICALLYFAAGGPIWHFLVMIPIFLAGVGALIFTSGYRIKRVLAFLDPFGDPQGFTYHISQVLIALGSGSLFGLGLGNSRQKFEYIPEVITDSIFGVVGEEFGFVGGAVLIILFAFLVLRGIRVAANCPDNFGKILALGLTSWLGIQTVVNLSAMVALVPLTGVPLPFISYGGSALVANLTAVGILLNISKQSG